MTYEETSVTCPDCGLGQIRVNDRCDNCGLSWEDLEAAAAFLDRVIEERDARRRPRGEQ